MMECLLIGKQKRERMEKAEISASVHSFTRFYCVAERKKLEIPTDFELHKSTVERRAINLDENLKINNCTKKQHFSISSLVSALFFCLNSRAVTILPAHHKDFIYN